MEQIITLTNGRLTARVNLAGAELCGIYAHKTDTEYMWQPGHEIWDHSNLLLFPNPGRIAGDRIIANGKVYPAMMHGFACKRMFAVAEQGSDRLILELAADDDTRRYFPYAFCLQVEFQLEGERLLQHIRVINRDDKPVYYCLGAHPAFYCPLHIDGSADDCYLEFDCPQNLNMLHMQQNTRLLTGEETPYLRGTQIPLHEHFFDNGPKLLGGMAAKTIALRSKKDSRFVEMGIEGFENLCLWGAPTRMSLIAIEPWLGANDRVDTDHVWEHKPGIQCAPVGQTNTHTLTFRVG